MKLRGLTPEDYDVVVSVVDDWWGRPIAGSLPRLFFDHFFASSFVAFTPGAPMAGFLVGLLSPSVATEAYIHFVGVAPSMRGAGVGRALYDAFFALAVADGRTRVCAITSPVNSGSIAFHQRMGFTANGPYVGYDGPGKDMVKFTRPL